MNESLKTGLRDPKKEGDHESEHGADRPHHQCSIGDGLCYGERVVFFGYAFKSGPEGAQIATVFVVLELGVDVLTGEL